MENETKEIDWLAELANVTIRFEKLADTSKANAEAFILDLKKDREEFEKKKINLAKSHSLS